MLPACGLWSEGNQIEGSDLVTLQQLMPLKIRLEPRIVQSALIQQWPEVYATDKCIVVMGHCPSFGYWISICLSPVPRTFRLPKNGQQCCRSSAYSIQKDCCVPFRSVSSTLNSILSKICCFFFMISFPIRHCHYYMLCNALIVCVWPTILLRLCNDKHFFFVRSQFQTYLLMAIRWWQMQCHDIVILSGRMEPKPTQSIQHNGFSHVTTKNGSIRLYIFGIPMTNTFATYAVRIDAYT